MPVQMLDPINESNYLPKPRIIDKNSKNYMSLKVKNGMSNSSKDRFKRVVSTFNKQDWNKTKDRNNNADAPMIEEPSKFLAISREGITIEPDRQVDGLSHR